MLRWKAGRRGPKGLRCQTLPGTRGMQGWLDCQFMQAANTMIATHGMCVGVPAKTEDGEREGLGSPPKVGWPRTTHP